MDLELTYREVINAKAEGLAKEAKYGTTEQVQASLRDLVEFCMSDWRKLVDPAFDVDNICEMG